MESSFSLDVVFFYIKIIVHVRIWKMINWEGMKR